MIRWGAKRNSFIRKKNKDLLVFNVDWGDQMSQLAPEWRIAWKVGLLMPNPGKSRAIRTNCGLIWSCTIHSSKSVPRDKRTVTHRGLMLAMPSPSSWTSSILRFTEDCQCDSLYEHNTFKWHNFIMARDSFAPQRESLAFSW